MKTFLNYFKSYFTVDFNLPAHLIVLLFISVCIYINYEFEIYSNYFRVRNYQELGVLKLWGMYAFAFFVPLAIISYFQKRKRESLSDSNSGEEILDTEQSQAKKNPSILNPHYIALGLLSLLFVAVDSSFYLTKFAKIIIPTESVHYQFASACLSNVISLFSIVTPSFLMYLSVKKFHPELYGLRLNGANLKPYLWLVLLMTPIVAIASTGEDFHNYYPSYPSTRVNSSTLPEPLKVAIYELCYGFDFLSVELIFRGVMVVALSRFVGKEAILPMVACYAFLHFGKPMVETIGSVFGGFALGVLAYKSRNIYGGLIVHLGVAWGMEIAAFYIMK